MEDLTKTQIVLLTLLVSFITSIATGIITTSLLAQAPAGVTQTIDRVVERTVEKMAPQDGTSQTVREVTVVKEEDAILSSIDSGSKAIVRLYSVSPVQTFYAIGVVVSKDGLVLTDKRDLVVGGQYQAVFADGTKMDASVWAVSTDGPYALFKISPPTNAPLSLAAITLSQNDPQLGQTVIAIEGRDKNAVAVGRALSVSDADHRVLTDIPFSAETAGGPLLNLSGELVGLKTSNTDLTLPQSSYTTITTLAAFVAAHS